MHLTHVHAYALACAHAHFHLHLGVFSDASVCRARQVIRLAFETVQCVAQCGYKYLLNSASIGYANKFKYLLLCGSTVIYVQDGITHKEFYEYGLLPGVHYVTVPTAADVPAMVWDGGSHTGTVLM